MSKLIIIMKKAGKRFLAALLVIAIVSAAALIYGLIADRAVSLSRIVMWNYVISAVVIIIGTVVCSRNSERRKALSMQARLPNPQKPQSQRKAATSPMSGM